MHNLLRICGRHRMSKNAYMTNFKTFDPHFIISTNICAKTFHYNGNLALKNHQNHFTLKPLLKKKILMAYSWFCASKFFEKIHTVAIDPEKTLYSTVYSVLYCLYTNI